MTIAGNQTAVKIEETIPDPPTIVENESAALPEESPSQGTPTETSEEVVMGPRDSTGSKASPCALVASLKSSKKGVKKALKKCQKVCFRHLLVHSDLPAIAELVCL